MTNHLITSLTIQHREIERHAAWLQRLLGGNDWSTAHLVVSLLDRMVVHHDEIEQSLMFPLVARSAPELGSQLRFVRAQHRAREEARRRLARRLLAGMVAGIVPFGDELFALVAGNHASEELLLYCPIESWRPSPPTLVHQAA